MFFDILGIAFLVELLIGIGIGWLFATFFARRKDTFENMWIGDTATNLSSLQSANLGISGGSKNFQAFTSDSTALQQKVANLEATLAHTEAKWKKAQIDFESCRESRDRSVAYALSLKDEVDNLHNKIAEEQSISSTFKAQIVNLQQELADVRALAQALEASKADINKTAMRLKGDLDSALAIRDSLQSQITVYKNKMRIVGAQLDTQPES